MRSCTIYNINVVYRVELAVLGRTEAIAAAGAGVQDSMATGTQRCKALDSLSQRESHPVHGQVGQLPNVVKLHDIT